MLDFLQCREDPQNTFSELNVLKEDNDVYLYTGIYSKELE